MSALKRVQLPRDKWTSAGTKLTVRLREVSASRELTVLYFRRQPKVIADLSWVDNTSFPGPFRVWWRGGKKTKPEGRDKLLTVIGHSTGTGEAECILLWITWSIYCLLLLLSCVRRSWPSMKRPTIRWAGQCRWYLVKFTRDWVVALDQLIHYNSHSCDSTWQNPRAPWILASFEDALSASRNGSSPTNVPDQSRTSIVRTSVVVDLAILLLLVVVAVSAVVVLAVAFAVVSTAVFVVAAF